MRLIEKGMNCKQSIEKQLGVSASEKVDNTIGLEKAVSPKCRVKTKVWSMDAINSGAMNMKTTRNG